MDRLLLTRGHANLLSDHSTLFEPFSRLLHSLLSLIPMIHVLMGSITDMEWRVIIVVFLILMVFPRGQLDFDTLRYVTLLGMAENRGECSVMEEKLSKRDTIIVEKGETEAMRERAV